MKRSMLLLSFFLVGACAVDTTGLLEPENYQFTATPNAICPGESSTLDWEVFNVPTSREYCDTPVSSGRLCTITEECDIDQNCIDGQCLAPGDDPLEIDFGEGCPLDGQVTINDLSSTTGAVETDIVVSDRQKGRNAVSPAETTVYAALFDVDGERVSTQFATVSVFGLDDQTERIGLGTLGCRSAGSTLTRTLGSSVAGFDPSSSVELRRVTNVSTVTVVVTSSLATVPPVYLAPGESNFDFNGEVPRTWTVRIDPRELPPPTSCAVDTGGFEPVELALELAVGCPQ